MLSMIEVLTPTEAAKLLKISTKTLGRLKKERLIDCAQVKNKVWYTIEDINNFLCRHKSK